MRGARPFDVGGERLEPLLPVRGDDSADERRAAHIATPTAEHLLILPLVLHVHQGRLIAEVRVRVIPPHDVRLQLVDDVRRHGHQGGGSISTFTRSLSVASEWQG